MSSPISNAAIATSMAQDAEDKMEVGEIGDAEVSVATKEIGSGSTVPSSALAATNDTTGSAAPQTSVTSSATTKSSSSGPPSAVEFEPPVACVRRILKKTLPSSSNVGKDAVAAFARASGIFIIYLTACANDFARENRRQTITANDVLAAIKVGSLFPLRMRLYIHFFCGTVVLDWKFSVCLSLFRIALQ